VGHGVDSAFNNGSGFFVCSCDRSDCSAHSGPGTK